jgi:hypothetical protein
MTTTVRFRGLILQFVIIKLDLATGHHVGRSQRDDGSTHFQDRRQLRARCACRRDASIRSERLE